MKRGIFFLIAGPAGVGKTTLLAQFVAAEKTLVRAVSVTTRAPRPGEVDGVSYNFWDSGRFESAAQRGEFLEHAVVHGKRYGTLSAFVEESVAAGNDVVKDIDVQGVALIRAQEKFKYPNTVAIFVMPPSREDLIKRLAKRASEDAEMFALRLKNAEAEMGRAGEYDYVVVNEEIEKSVAALKAIRLAEHCKRERMES